ncbi:MAG: acyl-ACP thioesterase [Pseudomonadota bacterium]
MIGPLETIRDTVNSWECDENDHINIKAYAWRFDRAVRTFLVEAGWQVPHRLGRIIRYHAELRGGEPVHATTGMVALTDGRIALEHRLYASQRMSTQDGFGVLTATSLDVLPDVSREDLSAFDVPPPSDHVLPKSGDLALSGAPTAEALETLTATYRSVIGPDAFGPAAESADGPMLTDQYLVGMISDSATHAWALAGADDAWLRSKNWGRAAVELKLTYGLRPSAGDVVTIMTGMRARSSKTVSFRHHVINTMTDTVIAIADITSLMLNLETRRAMVWPDDKLAHLDSQIEAFKAATVSETS